MKTKTAVFLTAALFAASGATACGAVQDEVQQQAEDEVNQQRTRAEQRLQEEGTRALEQLRTTVDQGN